MRSSIPARRTSWEGRLLTVGFASGTIPDLSLVDVLIRNVAVWDPPTVNRATQAQRSLRTLTARDSTPLSRSEESSRAASAVELSIIVYRIGGLLGRKATVNEQRLPDAETLRRCTRTGSPEHSPRGRRICLSDGPRLVHSSSRSDLR